MHSALILVFSSLASFIGSMQLGAVNVFVIDTTLTQNKRNAYWVAFGGIIPEFIYCALAVYSGSFLLRNSSIAILFKIVLVLVLTGLGFVYFFKKHKITTFNSSLGQDNVKSNSLNCFFKGFSLALLNPQLLPFWVFVLVYFNSLDFLTVKSSLNKLAYIGGAGFGAWLLLIILTETVTKYKSKIMTYLNHKYYYKTLAVIFFAIALQQTISIL